MAGNWELGLHKHVHLPVSSVRPSAAAPVALDPETSYHVELLKTQFASSSEPEYDIMRWVRQWAMVYAANN